MSARSSWQRFWIWLAILVAPVIGFLLARFGNRRSYAAVDEAALNLAAAAGTLTARPAETEAAAAEDTPVTPEPVRFSPWPPLLVAVLGLGGMAIFLAIAPKAAAGGWLLAFVFWSGIPIGSLVAMMIHALTGGRWGIRFNAVFMPTAAALPIFVALLIPVLAAMPGFYPWVFGSSRVPPDVAHYYLNYPFFIGRSAIAFCVWSLLAYLLPRLSGRIAVVTAGIGLAFYGLIIGTIGTDWILSLEPMFMSTSFGASLAFVQLASAFAWALVISPGRIDDTGLADVGGLLLATLLGITYVNFMAVLVIWYGDLPHKVFWFVHRDHWPWTLIGGLLFVFGAVIPIFSLFVERIRSSRRSLRIVAAITLTGISLYFAYLVAPPFGVLSLGAAGVAMMAIGGLLLAFLASPWSRATFDRWKAAYER